MRPRKHVAYGTGRNRLLGAAREILVATGGDLDVEAVASTAGVSKGLIWRHFGNRSGLLAAIVEHFWDSYDRTIDDPRLLPSSSWTEREFERLRRTVDFLADEPLAPVVLTRLAGDAVVQSVHQRRITNKVNAAAANLRRGQASGDVPDTVDPELIGAMIVGGMHQAVIVALPIDTLLERERFTKVLWQAIAGALSLAAPPSRG